MTIDDVTLDFPETINAYAVERWKIANEFTENESNLLTEYLASSQYDDDRGGIILEMYANRNQKRGLQ
jgi:hypothetical protein